MLIGICERGRGAALHSTLRFPCTRIQRQTPLDIIRGSRSLSLADRGPGTCGNRMFPPATAHTVSSGHRVPHSLQRRHRQTTRVQAAARGATPTPPRQGGCAQTYTYRATLSTVISKVHESATSLRRGGGGLRRWWPSCRPAASRSPWLRLGLRGRGRGRGRGRSRGRSRSRVRGKGRARGRLALG